MSENIIERAAIAITPGWATASRNTRRKAMLTVAGVLEAVQEPTETMVQAASPSHANQLVALAFWSAMIRAALADKPV